MQRVILNVKESVSLETLHVKEFAMLNMFFVKIVAIKLEKIALA